MIDPEKIRGIFRNLDTYVDPLRQLAELPLDEFTRDMVALGAAKYYLQTAIECCIDTANHIISRQGYRAPNSYADSFAVLAENGIIGQEFAASAMQMARMRNRLVHLYWEVDAPILHGVLSSNLGDFDRFKGCVHRFMRALEQEGSAD
ncbi:MAG: DUF86 domain-containing protein [Ardenticatenales bacterium]|nr:DUF86 domain-containing protein [Ardenticatenales bacterium]